MTNNLAILQACLLRDLKGKATAETFTELRKAPDFFLRMITCAAQDPRRITGFSVVTHQHLWLNLTQMSDWERLTGLFDLEIQDNPHKFERQQKDFAAFNSLMPPHSHNLLPGCHATLTSPPRATT